MSTKLQNNPPILRIFWDHRQPNTPSLSTSTANMSETNPPPTNPFVSLLQNLRLPFPFPPSPPDQKSDSQNNPTTTLNRDKPDVVKFADTPTPSVPPTLKIESEESAQSSAVVWQVYALGGYLLARWIWGKWKERQNDNDNNDQPSDRSTPPPPSN